MDEKRKIIDLVSQGKISAEEAAKLLQALNPKTQIIKKGKRLVLQVKKEGAEKPKVNLSIPLNLAKISISFLSKNGKINASFGNSNFDFSSINWKEIIEMATSGEIGELFYLEVEEDDGSITLVRVFVE
ncbi:MAG: hypothetical protein HQ534_08335 [Armatimonadetes bacterium]|nr:hypothetical protein [Armatimonadota bacterium]